MRPQSVKPSRLRLDRIRLLWIASFATLLAAIILWGGLQHEDPLQTVIYTDKMRHIVGFGALGLLAAMAPSPRSRLAGAIAACMFALSLEIAQHFTPDRTMSGRDFIASSIGVFAGLGFGSALLTAVGLVRAWRAPRTDSDA